MVLRGSCWGQKCFKTVSWIPPGPTFRAGARNASKQSSGGLLGSFSGLGPEMLQNCPLEASWAHFPGWGQKCFKTVLWRLPGLTGLEAWPHKPLYFTVVFKAWPHKPLYFTRVFKAWPHKPLYFTMVFKAWLHKPLYFTVVFKAWLHKPLYLLWF